MIKQDVGKCRWCGAMGKQLDDWCRPDNGPPADTHSTGDKVRPERSVTWHLLEWTCPQTKSICG